jgi:thymidylate synthase
MDRRPRRLPQATFVSNSIDAFKPEEVAIHGYDPHPAIKYQLNV